MSWIVSLNSFFKFWISIKNFKNSLSNIFLFFKNTVALFQKNIGTGKKSQGICNNSQDIFVTTFAIIASKMLDNLSRNLRNLKRPPQLIRKQVRDHYAQKLLRLSLWIKSFPTSVTSLRLQRFKTPAVTL